MNGSEGRDSKDAGRSGATISREFDYPRDAIFKMFTDAKKAATFWGPEGAEKLVFELDPKPGGAIRIHDRNTDGIVVKTRGTVVELVAPVRLAFRTVTSPPGFADPFEALQTMTFEELGPKRTRVTVLVKVLAMGSFPGSVESLEEGFQGGWGETLEMLQRTLGSGPSGR